MILLKTRKSENQIVKKTRHLIISAISFKSVLSKSMQHNSGVLNKITHKTVFLFNFFVRILMQFVRSFDYLSFGPVYSQSFWRTQSDHNKPLKANQWSDRSCSYINTTYIWRGRSAAHCAQLFSICKYICTNPSHSIQTLASFTVK